MLNKALTATNAAKAVIALILNALIQFSTAFHIYAFDSAQKAALAGVVNCGFLLYVLATYEWSHKRTSTSAANTKAS